MELKVICALLETTGIPVTYRAFPEGEAPPLPFICYMETGSNNFGADGIVYKKIKGIQIELYTVRKDVESEDKVEQAISSFYWSKDENYIDSERCYQIVYEMEV